MATENFNESENRDGSNSSANNDESPARKKRARVGDLKKHSYDMGSADNDRNPYKNTNSESEENRSERPAYNRDNNRGGYSNDRQGGYNNDRRSSYGGGERGSYNNDRQGGYNNDRRGGYENRGGYDNRQGNSEGYNRRPSGERSYNNDRQGGYNNGGNRGGGYSNDRQGGYNNGGNRSGGYNNDRQGGYNNGGNRGGYNNDRQGGYNNDRRGGYNNDRQGGYNNDRRGGYDNQRGGGRNFEPGPKRIVKPVKYKENIDPDTPIRLNKYLANAGVCSRREADSFITGGLVKVNGEVINELGAKVLRGDLVTFNEQPIRLESKVYVLLNKPKNCVTTSDDPQNRTTVMDLVKGACPERIYPVGRLDRNTTGVLLLTNDGDLASKLMHPKYKKKKIYQVTLDRDVAIEDMQAIADGIELEDGEIHADSIAYQAEDIMSVVGIEIHSGRNRIVRRIFEKLNYQVVKLDRVYFAGLTKKNVQRGKWRYLSEKEVNMLRMGAFE